MLFFRVGVFEAGFLFFETLAGRGLFPVFRWGAARVLFKSAGKGRSVHKPHVEHYIAYRQGGVI